MTIPSDRVLQLGTTNRSGDKPRCCGAAPKCWRPPLNQDTTSTSDLHHALPILNLFFHLTERMGFTAHVADDWTTRASRRPPLLLLLRLSSIFYHLAERTVFTLAHVADDDWTMRASRRPQMLLLLRLSFIFTPSPRGWFLPLPMSPTTGQRERAGDRCCCSAGAISSIFTTSPRGRFLPLPMSPMTGQRERAGDPRCCCCCTVRECWRPPPTQLTPM